MTTYSPLNNTYNSTSIYNLTTTWRRRSPDSNFFDAQYTTGLVVATGSITSLLAIVFNLFIIVTILSQRKLRKSVFLWNTLSLCFNNLLVATVVIPLNTNTVHIDKWIHGYEVCKIFVVLDCGQITLTALLLASANINRVLRLKRSTDPNMERSFLHKDFLPNTTVVIPWVYLIVICVPILIVGEKPSMSKKMMSEDSSICYHFLKREFYYALIFIVMFCPITVLFFVAVASVLYFKFSKTSWHRFRNDNTDDADNEVKTLRSSFWAALLSTAAFLIAWLPLAIFVAIVNFCKECRITYLTIIRIYQWACASTVLTPLPWLVHDGIRNRLAELLCGCRDKIVATYSKVRRPLDNDQDTLHVAKWTAKGTPVVDGEMF